MSLTLSPTLIADAPPLELLDHEPIAVPVARPVCACPLRPGACTCPTGVALWE